MYQTLGNTRSEVPGRYVLWGRNTVGFEVAKYDRTNSLIIDPILAYGTYLGGSGNETGRPIATDSTGNVYIAGAGFDAIIAGLPPGAALKYSTYNDGDGDDYGTGIAVDLTGTVAAAGFTSSTTVVVPNALHPANAGGWDAFVAKVSDFSLTLQPLFTGKSAVRGFNVIVTPLGPFNGIVTLTCSFPADRAAP